MIKVLKRDGIIKDFSASRIRLAIENAYNEVYDNKWDDDLVNELESCVETIEDIILGISCSTDILSVEDIQDIVVTVLGEINEVVKSAYEDYRNERTRVRDINGNFIKGISGLIDLTNVEVTRENSNKNASVNSTQRDLIAGEVSKFVSKTKLIPPHIVKAHEDGVLHWHDMDYTIQPMHNCMLVNLEDMFAKGTVINEKMVETPKSFETACTVATQIMAQISGNEYGGQSITIRHLAPYLRTNYDKEYRYFMEVYNNEQLAKSEAIHRRNKALRDGVQTIRYQLSTLQSVNGQSPFCTIYLEIVEGDEYEEEQALIVEEMIRQRLEGMKNYKGQEIGEAFPKLVYLLDEHNCLEGGKYDYITKLAAKCNVKRLVPDYQSAKIMRENYEGNTFPPMGCRSHLSPWKDEEGNYKWYGRFNQGVISLNLPQIGIIAKGDEQVFWDLFNERLELCKEALIKRHELLEGTLSDASPIHWQHGAIARLKKGEKIDKLLHNGFSTLSLGYVGICELTYAMLGVSHTTEKGEEFALKVMNHMRKKCDEWKKETGLGFGLYGSPAENLIYRFCRIDKARFGEIKNVTDRLYYTNSYHVHVCEEIDAFSKLKFESQFHSISNGGCISYVEVPDMSKNLEAVEKIINFIYHNVQYAEINAKPDVCYKCGFRGELKNDENLNWYCPNCDNHDETEMQVMRRTCGYIGTNYWSKGRTAEIKERVIHL